MSGRVWGWHGLLAAALFGIGAVFGRAIASALNIPAAIGGVIGAAIGFLVAGVILRRAAAAHHR
ncbi:MAG: hypothetical protein LC789_16120 [Actinobacteria bacterium]|nr:hypothetical protein [Actinomycetota bacterium]